MLDDRAEFADWLRLLEAPGLGRERARRLMAAFGAPTQVFQASPGAQRDVAGAAAAAALAARWPDFEQRLAHARRWLDGAPRRGVLPLGDPAYPPLLLQTADPPLWLFVEGDPALLSAPALAIVGSRHPSAGGVDNARALAAAVGRAGFVVVSGLALGIDGAAHEGALDAGCATVAVVGTGLDIVYPTRHRTLAGHIAADGLLASEFAPGMPPLAANFPLRNRIIAGLTRGTLVVEAALRSGSLITARLAAEAGREVFAVPGSIHAPQSRGCHELIRQGAKLVETVDDILEELAVPHARAAAALPTAEPAAPAEAGNAADGALLRALGHDPVTLDALAARTGWPAHELNARLLELELDGRIARLPGGLFQRRGVA